jgi:hypothetical protein
MIPRRVLFKAARFFFLRLRSVRSLRYRVGHGDLSALVSGAYQCAKQNASGMLAFYSGSSASTE